MIAVWSSTSEFTAAKVAEEQSRRSDVIRMQRRISIKVYIKYTARKQDVNESFSGRRMANRESSKHIGKKDSSIGRTADLKDILLDANKGCCYIMPIKK
jgi:hypothetical protein